MFTPLLTDNPKYCLLELFFFGLRDSVSQFGMKNYLVNQSSSSFRPVQKFAKQGVIKVGQMKVKMISMTNELCQNNLGFCENHYAKIGYPVLLRTYLCPSMFSNFDVLECSRRSPREIWIRHCNSYVDNPYSFSYAHTQCSYGSGNTWGSNPSVSKKKHIFILISHKMVFYYCIIIFH